MQPENKLPSERFRPETQDSRVTVQERGRSLTVHKILESELRDITTLKNSFNVNLAFFTLLVGLGVGFVIVLLTSHQTLSDRMLTLFSGLSLLSIAFSLYFGVKARMEWREAQKKVDRILQDDEQL
jgi:hypothetical protein